MLTLRPYQEKIVNKTIENLQKKRKQMVVLPTGGGKTVIFSHIIARMKKKTLIVAHTKELITQIYQTLSSIVPKDVPWEVRTIQGCIKKVTIQKLKKKEFQLLIVDECHRSASFSYKKLITELGFEQKFLCGFTATPYRADGKSLYEIFGFPEWHLTILDMIKEGYLCDFKGYRVRTNVSLKGVSTKEGDFVASKLASVINVKNRNQLIVKEYIKISLGKKAVCFCATVDHAKEVSNEFVAQGISSAVIHGDIGDKQRKNLLLDFKSGKIQVICNCQLLTEGFDEPSIECLLMARPTTSKGLYVQMIGRGARLFPSKNYCQVIEFTDNEYDVCSIEELVGDTCKKIKIKHEESLTEYALRAKKELLEEAQETIIEEMQITQKSFYEKPASSWQKQFLASQKIEFHPNISEYQANILMSEKYGHN